MTFKFIQEDHFTDGRFPTKVEMTFESDVTWGELMDGFVQFLRGCGYFLPDDAYPTIIDRETGADKRIDVDALWDKYAVEEENANTTSGY